MNGIFAVLGVASGILTVILIFGDFSGYDEVSLVIVSLELPNDILFEIDLDTDGLLY